MEKESQTIFEKNVIEFVTVAAEFCAFLERAEHMKRKAFVDTSLKILPLLYLKASLLPLLFLRLIIRIPIYLKNKDSWQKRK